MKNLLALAALALVLALAGCSGGYGANSGDPSNIANDPNNWHYVKGPHGENCLVLSYALTYNNAVLAMSCDSVNPGK